MKTSKIDDWKSVDYMKGVTEWIDRNGVYLMHRKQGFIVTGCGQWGIGVRGTILSPNEAKKFANEMDAEHFLRSHYALTIGKPMTETYIILRGLPDLSQSELWSDYHRHWTTAELNDGDCGYGPLPWSCT